MNRKPTTPQELALVNDLLKRGVFFDKEAVEEMRTDCLGLSIHQLRGLPSTASDLPSGETLFALHTAISNDSPQMILSPLIIVFDGPEWSFPMTLLPDPLRKIPREGPHYVLNPREAPYERDSVLNHLIGRRCMLAPGQSVDGFLLAAVPVAMPWRCRDRGHFQVRVTLFDQKRRSQESLFRLSVQRGPEHKRMMERLTASGGTRKRCITVD